MTVAIDFPYLPDPESPDYLHKLVQLLQQYITRINPISGIQGGKPNKTTSKQPLLSSAPPSPGPVLTFQSVGATIPPDNLLTNREREILHLILEERKTTEIAEELCISVRTVDTHRSNMLQKTGAKNAVGLAKYAFKWEFGTFTSP